MKSPLNASQTIAAVAVTAALLAGAYALGRSQDSNAPVTAESTATEATTAATPKPAQAPPVTRVAAAAPAPATVAKPAAARLCDECARVVDVHSEERKGQGSGLGAVGGALIGGLLGNQVGGGTGKKIATVGGAVAGGMAGNEIEKRSKSNHVWIVQLVNKDGGTQRHEQGQDPQVRVGDVVIARDGRLERQ